MNECWKLDGTPLKEKLEPVLEKLVEFEKILSERGTTFFAGKVDKNVILINYNIIDNLDNNNVVIFKMISFRIFID